ncbi:MAG: chemotaxis protein CheB [candidate division NC10 bacterium]|nr:chemotaxis protein CheB [candidate division NC10 bacterium]MBI4841075.1 chemotaxis protein CheB [candidate division NC10 bacterium]
MKGDEGQPVRNGRRLPRGLPLALAIGASTGGPRALLTLLADLQLPVPAPVFLVQHIHPKFTRILTRRLGEVSSLPIQEAEEGAVVQPGRIYIAPGGRHLVVERGVGGTCRTRLTADPPRHGVRPSVDELFTSVAEAFGPRAVGVVLTGMGRDGLAGARALKARGGTVLAEAEETCVVYGMPRALAEAALADRVVPIGEMAEAIRQVCLGLTAGSAPALLPMSE